MEMCFLQERSTKGNIFWFVSVFLYLTVDFIFSRKRKPQVQVLMKNMKRMIK